MKAAAAVELPPSRKRQHGVCFVLAALAVALLAAALSPALTGGGGLGLLPQTRVSRVPQAAPPVAEEACACAVSAALSHRVPLAHACACADAPRRTLQAPGSAAEPNASDVRAASAAHPRQPAAAMQCSRKFLRFARALMPPPPAGHGADRHGERLPVRLRDCRHAQRGARACGHCDAATQRRSDAATQRHSCSRSATQLRASRRDRGAAPFRNTEALRRCLYPAWMAFPTRARNAACAGGALPAALAPHQAAVLPLLQSELVL
jgi:hypothetical protein